MQCWKNPKAIVEEMEEHREIRLTYLFESSENHGMFWVESDLKDHLVPTPCAMSRGITH